LFFGDFSYQQWAGFMLVLLRVSSLVLTLPFFGSANIPAMSKAGLCLAMAVLLAPAAGQTAGNYPTNVWGFVPLIAGEILIGAVLGFTVRLFLASVQIMGQLAGFQMGFAVANVLDPLGGGQVSVLAQFCYLMSLLVMFSVGGHLVFFEAMADSFSVLPVGGFTLRPALYEQLVNLTGQMFVLALRMGLPVIGALLFTQTAMGILAKTVPQMNILMVGFPVTITVGLVFLSVTLAVMLPVLSRLFAGLGPLLNNLLRAM
jgi:flagellar biosynthetic protein FliR